MCLHHHLRRGSTHWASLGAFARVHTTAPYFGLHAIWRQICTTPLDGKPVAIMGASTGSFGTVRAQMHLRQVCAYNNMLPLQQPMVLVSRAERKFDEEGRLQHEATARFVGEQMEALVEWTLRLKEG